MDQANNLRKIVRSKANKHQIDVNSHTGLSNNSGNSPHVIAVTSGKGGVGKTNITGNLAVALSQMNKKVIIFDADLGLANIDIIFNIKPEYNIMHVLEGEVSLSKVIVDGPKGIKIIPAGSGFSQLTHLTEGQKLNLLTEFEGLQDEVDFFLIDTGAGISSNVLYFNIAADECIIIATFEPTSLTDAYAMIKVMATEHGTRRFKLLVNMVQDEKAAKTVYKSLSEAADRFLNGVVVEYLGYIPNDNKLRDAVLDRNTVVNLFPGAVSSQKFIDLADRIVNMPRQKETDGNIKFFLNKFFSYNMENLN